MGVRSTKLCSRIAAGFVLGLLFIGHAPALAQSPFAGVYFGNISGCGFGNFAVLVRTNNVGVLLAYSTQGDQVFLGFVNENIPIGSNGTFGVGNVDGFGTFASGTFTGSGVTGTFSRPGCAGSFSGNIKSNVGFLRNAGGYYKGSHSGNIFLDGANVGNQSGPISAIIAADGSGFTVTLSTGTVFGVPIQGIDGGSITVAQNLSITGTILVGASTTGILNPNANPPTASGTYFFSQLGVVINGNWTIRRLIPLPDKPNNPPVAVNDDYEMLWNRALTVSAPGVLVNDSDPEGDPLTANLVGNPSNGTLALSANGGFTFIPDAGFSGVNAFSYRANDGSNNSNPATVTITVKAVRALPWLSLLLD